MARKKTKAKRGRPPGGRMPTIVHMLPEVIGQIDGMVDPDDQWLSSRGRVIESRFRKKDGR